LVARNFSRRAIVADVSTELNELEGINVYLILTFDDKTKSKAYPRTAKLYDETQENAGYTRCVRLKGLHDPFLSKDADDNVQLQHWTSYVTGISFDPAVDVQLLMLGTSGKVGLTSETLDTATKKLNVLSAAQIAAFTAEDLKAAGL
jgi:hypothetical protein